MVVRDENGGALIEDEAGRCESEDAQGRTVLKESYGCLLALPAGTWTLEASTPEGLRGSATVGVDRARDPVPVIEIRLR
jgi:hypothetical protein